MEFRLQQVARALGVSVEADAAITGWSIDSRTVAPGDLFFALRGPNHDGNAYVEDVLRKGAVAAIANEPKPGAILLVPDTLAALKSTAIWARDQWAGDVIGITGSAGKTSTKDVIAAMLGASMPVGKTIGNLNNQFGVPLSILRLPENARVAVLEMGMNHAGEIRELCAIAKPRIGVVTNVGHAHIEAFDSIEGIAAAKRELIESLPPDGVAVLNADDPFVSKFGSAHPGRSITFGIHCDSEVRAKEVRMTGQGVSFSVNGVKFESALFGRHNVLNILAGLAVASLYGIGAADLADVVRQLEVPLMRGRRFVQDGVVIFDDCYNSNPDAARSMIDLLRDSPGERRIAVLGEMLELGAWSERLHRDVGHYAAASGIDFVFGVHGAAEYLVAAARDAGMSADAAQFFPDAFAAGDSLRPMGRPGDVILFKGSRGTHVEHALERFIARPN